MIKWFFHSIAFKAAKTIRILEAVLAEFIAWSYHIVPASLRWLWVKHICHEIDTIPIHVTVNKITRTAYLNIHGSLSLPLSNREVCPVLFSHGDYGHPCTMLHLADIVKTQGQPVFSLYIPGVRDMDHFHIFDSLLQKALDKIEEIVEEKCGKFSGILVAGHSKGSILLAQRQFVVLDERIKATCAIGGRLNAPTDADCSDNALKIVVKTIYAGISKHTTLPLMQIIPKDDWNSSYESMAVRPEEHCYTVPGKHLSGLYTHETRVHFNSFLEHFLPANIIDQSELS